MGHKDSDFFAFNATTQLPLINIVVPTPSFFIAAPVVTGGLYVYLHIYLIGLWYALAKAPTRISDEPLEKHVYPTLLCTSALVVRGWMRPEQEKPVEGRGPATVAIGTLMTWFFGPSILALLWLRFDSVSRRMADPMDFILVLAHTDRWVRKLLSPHL